MKKKEDFSNCELIGKFVPSKVKGYYTLVPVSEEELFEEIEKMRQEKKEKKSGL